MIGKRLKAARLQLGLSLNDVSELTGSVISQPSISRYETGQQKIPSDNLRLLARALRKPVGYFRSDPTKGLHVEMQVFNRLPIKECERLRSIAKDLVERYAEAETLLSRMSKAIPRFSVPATSKAAAFAAADRLRFDWQMGACSIHCVTDLLESKSIRVFGTPGSSDFTSAIARVAGQPNAILFNNDLKVYPATHQRYHILTALGYAYMGENTPKKVVAQFASGLAMNANSLCARLGERRTTISVTELKGVASSFGVPVKAALQHIYSIGIIRQHGYKAMKEQMDAIGWQDCRPKLYAHNELPRRLFEMLCRGVIENTISQSKAAQLCGMTLGKFRAHQFKY